MPAVAPAGVLKNLRLQINKNNRSTPLAGAEVTIYDAGGVVRWKGLSGADGTVSLKFYEPPAFVGWKVLVREVDYQDAGATLDNAWVSNYLIVITLAPTVQNNS